MDIQGLDYNTQREKLIMSEYGREVQKMVKHAISLTDKQERQACANQIIETMRCITQTARNNADKMQTLWNHLAVISEGKLDIDYPFEITLPERQNSKPEPVPYPTRNIPVKHYGKELFLLFDKLKEMEPGEERDALVQMTADQMRRCLMLWGHGTCDEEKVAADLAKFTDGVIQLDLDNFSFGKLDIRPDIQNDSKRKKKK